mmetsp:Transcript_42749/g.79157  ORF Transcript_42749/g.79157 Transcript_42749/m.79157 type:complete len:285 (-) Transcript_42749:775-1629(-)
MTRILSLSMIVLTRCAMVIMVLPSNASRSVRCISRSVSKSTLLVASSRRRTRHFRRRARPRHSSCLWPCDRLSPYSATVPLSPSGMASTAALIPHPSRADHSSLSSYSSNGSKFDRIVPENRTGFWGMIPSFDRRSSRPTRRTSTPSMTMGGLYEETAASSSLLGVKSGSTIRIKFSRSDDLPLPVLPTTPILSPPDIDTFSPFRTRGVPDRYLMCKSFSSIAPLEGQSASGYKALPPDDRTANAEGSSAASVPSDETDEATVAAARFSRSALVAGASWGMFSV